MFNVKNQHQIINILLQLIYTQMSDLQGVVDYNPVALGVNKVFGHSGLLTNLSNFISNTLFRNASKSVENFFFTVGAVAITYKILKTCYGTFNTWKWVPTHFANKKKFNESDLTQKYGNCYAVVTGCTEGIGLSYVIQLAKLGFGVVLVARNKQKLERRIIQVKNICPSFRYEKIIGDLCKVEDIKRITKQLVNLSQKIDIGMVVNNAGVTGQNFKQFVKYQVKTIQDILTINFYAPYAINAALVPVLRKRKERSAIINMASCCGVYLSQGNATYTPSKVMLDIYSRTLTVQNRDKLDIISIRPFGVSTPMLRMLKSKFIITPKDCVLSSLADLGNADTSWSGFMHKVQGSLIGKMSEQAIFYFYDKVFSTFKQ